MADFADAMRQQAEARIGRVLREKWRLDKLLGMGGMASVYAATHRNGKRGAVKMLHLELSHNELARTRFLREGYVANKVDHPGAVAVLDDDITEDGAVFLVMELLEGSTVEARAESQPSKCLPLGEVVGIADALLEVLAAAHDKGIIHRDLKPENLFLTKRGELKVLDFGIARLLEMAGSASATRTGSVLGTPAYMPPEQALGNLDQVDARTDLWAVGATMFAMLTGRPVHVADTVNKVLFLAMGQQAPPLLSVCPSAPAPIANVVDRALSFHQQNRWPDARTMQQALRDARNWVAGPATLAPWAPVSYLPNETTTSGTYPGMGIGAHPSGAGSTSNPGLPMVTTNPSSPGAPATFTGSSVGLPAPARKNTALIALIVACLCGMLGGLGWVLLGRPDAPKNAATAAASSAPPPETPAAASSATASAASPPPSPSATASAEAPAESAAPAAEARHERPERDHAGKKAAGSKASKVPPAREKAPAPPPANKPPPSERDHGF